MTVSHQDDQQQRVQSPTQKRAYDALVQENKALRDQVKALERGAKKQTKRKRAPTEYQKEWKRQYPLEVLICKSPHPGNGYSKQYSENMTTAPGAKTKEVFTAGDRAVFMRRMAERTRKAIQERKQGAAAPVQPEEEEGSEADAPALDYNSQDEA